MKNIFLVALFVGTQALASAPTIADAPLEWLVAQTIMIKGQESHDHFKADSDPLIEEIFEVAYYHEETDQLIFTTSFDSMNLRVKLLEFLKSEMSHELKPGDPLYNRWRRERAKKIVRIKKTKSTRPGFYYFNHVHTKYSQDNAELKLLKISPEKTFSLIENFLKKRDTKGTVAFCDHHQTNAYDDTLDMVNSRLNTLRSVEWGRKTHMSLIGIKDNWDLLTKGPDYKEEESIIASRSSGGFRIANHINKDHVFPYTKWLDVDGAEIWNTITENVPFTAFKLNKIKNRDALKQWAESLKHGKRATAVAGSDFHFITPCLRDKTLHYPANFIPAQSIDDTKEMLHKGRVSIVTQEYAPKLTLNAKFDSMNEWAHMGDEIQGKGDLSVKLFADFSDAHKLLSGGCYNTITVFSRALMFWKTRRWEMRFYNLEGKLVTKKRIYPKRIGKNKNIEASFKMPIKGEDVIRAELWAVSRKSKEVDILGITNPIYINR